MGEGEAWWKKAAQGVMESVKDKLVKKEPVVELNFGRNHPDVLNEVNESFRGAVIHISELGRFKSENAELCCYGIMVKEKCEFDGMEKFRSLFMVSSAGKTQFVVELGSRFAQEGRLGNAVALELGSLPSFYLLYKEFATTKPWVRFDSYSFEQFKASKVKK